MRTVPNHHASDASIGVGQRYLRVALVGQPNVGKSSVFRRLTGRYTTVSNYPGTSVELVRGHAHLDWVSVEITDTPGLHALLPSSDDERVTRRLLVDGGADVIVHVVDAKNLPLQLPLTLQLLELGRPLVLALNIMDEADRVGMRIAHGLLAQRLGVPVIPVVAVEGRGIDELRRAIVHQVTAPTAPVPDYGNGVREAIERVEAALEGTYQTDRRAIAALVLQEDAEVGRLVAAAEPDGGHAVRTLAARLAAAFGAPAAYRVAVERQRAAEELLRGVVDVAEDEVTRWTDRLGRQLSTPLVGVPALLVVLYVGLYLFVGRFGGGVVVDWLETSVFERWVNPALERLFLGIPWEPVRALYVGEYGMLTLGIRYALAIVLPIVGAFFLFFSLLEDSGYFPRLALLLDRVFKRLGLSGRAVIPMVLGFACDTMATMVTRTLDTRRERVLATLLLALAIPCSAQLGVILALLAGQPLAVVTWLVTVTGTFLLVGYLGARILPGERPTFQMEIPPLRRPRLGNVLLKTVTRVQWYFLEVLPLFLLASVLLWIGNLTGVWQVVIRGMGPVVELLGLPVETAQVFLLGFFRRDYGAAGLFDLHQTGLLDPIQIAVAGVTLTLFVPCIAQFLMMVQERGWRVALAMLAFITPFAFGVGFVVNVVLRALT